MVYGKNLIFNAQTGEMVEEMVTDAWILAHKPDQLWLTADTGQIQADGEDQALVTVQRVTPPLVDGHQNAIAQSGSVRLRVDDQVVTVDLDQNGQGTLAITSVETGQFVIAGEDLAANVLILEVI